MQEASSLSIPHGSGSRLHQRAGLRTAHYVAGAARRFIGGIYQSRFCRALFFDWRFRPRVVCKDPIRRGVAVQDISFDDCKDSYQVFRVPHARLQTDCNRYIAVTTKNELVPGASLYKLKPYTPNLAPEQNPAFGWGRVGSAPRRLRGTVLSLLSAGWANKNYYHWLTGVLPRIHLMEKSGLIANVDFYLIPDTKLDFQVETLDFLQIPRDARLSVRRHGTSLLTRSLPPRIRTPMFKTFPTGSSDGFAPRFWKSHPPRFTVPLSISGEATQALDDCSTNRSSSPRYFGLRDFKLTSCRKCRLPVRSVSSREPILLSAHTAPALQT